MFFMERLNLSREARMSTYTEHADSAGLERRLAVLASRADRATMLRALEERDIGCVTLTMSAHELKARCREARSGFVPPMTWAPALLAEED